MEFETDDCDDLFKDRTMVPKSSSSVSISTTPIKQSGTPKSEKLADQKYMISIGKCEIMLGITRFQLQTTITENGQDVVYNCTRKETDIMWLYDYLNNNYPNSYHLLPPRPCFLSCENTISKMIEIEQKLVDLPNLPKKCYSQKENLQHKLIKRNGAVLLSFLTSLASDPSFNEDRIFKALLTEPEMTVDRDMFSAFKDGFKRYLKKETRSDPSLELYEYFKGRREETHNALIYMATVLEKLTDVLSSRSDFYVRLLFLSFFMHTESSSRFNSQYQLSVKDCVITISSFENYKDSHFFSCYYFQICSIYGTIYSTSLLLKKRDKLMAELRKAEKANQKGLDRAIEVNNIHGGVDALKQSYHDFSLNAEKEIKSHNAECVKNIVETINRGFSAMKKNYENFEARLVQLIEKFQAESDVISNPEVTARAESVPTV